MIIAISGLAGTGKDTAADILVKNHGFVKVSLADPIKRICRDVFDFTEDQLWGPSESRNAPDRRYPRPLSPSYPAAVRGAVWIPLSQGHALVSEEDLARVVAAGPWCLVKKEAGKRTQYAKASINGVDTKLHHFIFGSVVEIDHINGDGLDNRRSNLRETDASLNHANMRPRTSGTSPFKGVSYDSSRKKWSAKIGVRGETVNIGRFDSEVEAAMAYDAAAKEHFGEHARTNVDCFLTPRYALQTLGTEYGRSCYGDVWVEYAVRVAKWLEIKPQLSIRVADGEKVMVGQAYSAKYGMESMENPPTYNGVVISDVRFKNEIAGLKKAGAKLVRIRRPGYETPRWDHPSETEQMDIPDEEFDLVINNQESIEDLADNISFLLENGILDHE